MKKTPEKSEFFVISKKYSSCQNVSFVSSTENQMSTLPEYKSILAGKICKGEALN
jgi:hypothetical protein